MGDLDVSQFQQLPPMVAAAEEANSVVEIVGSTKEEGADAGADAGVTNARGTRGTF